MVTNSAPPLFARRRGDRIALIAANTAAGVAALGGLAAMAAGMGVMGQRGLFAAATPAGLGLILILSLLVEATRRWGERPAVRRTLLGAALVVSVLTGVALINHVLGLAPLWRWPDVLARATGRELSAPVEISSVIVLGALGAAGAITLLLAKRPSRRAALGLASLGLVLSITSLIAGVAGVELAFGPELRSGAPLTSFALAAVCAAIALGCGLRELTVWLVLGASSETDVSEEEQTRQTHALAIVGVAAAATLVLAAVFTRDEVRDTEKSVGDSISGVAALKTQELVHWMAERKGDMRILLRQPVVAALLRGDEQRGVARELLEEVQRSYGYAAVVVFDAKFRPLVSTDTSAPIDPTAEWWAALRQNPSTQIACEFIQDPQQGVCLDFIGVVRDEGGRILGGVLMRQQVGRSFLPDLQRWPVKSDSAEVVIARIEGRRLRLITELRHRRGSAFRIQAPITIESEILSVQAMFNLPGTVLRGIDARGVPSIGVANRVPDSPWILVAKMDLAEALMDARDQVVETGLAIALLIGVAGTSVRLLWQQRQRGLIEQAREAETSRQEMAERFGVLMQRANDAILLFDEQRRVVEANPRATQLYGYAAEEWLGLTATDLRATGDRPTTLDNFTDALRDQGTIFQTVHQRKSGENFPVEVSSRPVHLGGERFVLSIVRDISERRAQEREIERLNRLYLLTSRILEVVVQSRTREELFNETSALLVQLGGMRLAWVGLNFPELAEIRPVAVAGTDGAQSYVEGIRVSSRGSVDEGRGPTGTAFRQARTYVVNDIANDPIMLPWRERAAQFGLRSAVALPLRCAGTTVGVLSAYSAEKNFFGAKQVEVLERAVANVSFALDVFARDERRRAAEAELKAGRDRLDFILSATTAVTFTIAADYTYRVTFISSNVRDLLGYPSEEFLVSPDAWSTRVHPDDLSWVLAKSAGWDRKAPLSREYRFKHADGNYIWMRDEMRLVCDADGRPLEIVGCWMNITGSKELAIQLERSEQLYRLIAENTTDVIWLYDLAAGRFTYMSPSSGRLLGYSREELLSMSMDQILTPSSAEQARERMSRLVAEARDGLGAPLHQSALYEHQHRDGRISIGEIVTSVVFDERRRPSAVLGVTRDVTERINSEAQLRKLSLAVEQNPSSIVITDLCGAIEYVNPQFTRVTGYTFDEVRGQNPRMLKSGLTPLATYMEMWGAITRGQPWRGELINRKKDGTFHVEMIIITAVTNAAGQPTHYIALKEDISERKRAEAEVRKLSRAVDQAPLSVVITSLSGAIEYVNPWFTKLTGYSLEDVRGRNPRVLKSGETPSAVYAEMWQTLGRGETWRGELYNRKKNGEVYCEAAVISPIAGADGVATHYVAIKEDITDRKRAEAALRESEARFRDLFDLESDTILLLEADSGKILQANRAASELYGYSVEELLTLRNIDLSAEPERTLETAHSGARQPDLVVQIPTRLHRKRDGSVFPVDMNLRFFQRGGRPYYLAAIRDVTERKRAEEALHDLVKQLRALHAVSTALQQAELPLEKMLNSIAPHLPWALRSPADAMACLRIDEVSVRVGDVGDPIERFAAPVFINGREAGLVEIGYVRRPPQTTGRLIDPRETETIESVARTLGLGLGARESFAAVQKFNAELEERVALRTEELAERNREMRALLQSIPDLVVRARKDGTVVYSQSAEDAASALPATPDALSPQLVAALLEAGRRALDRGGIVIEEAALPAGGDRAGVMLELRAAPVGTDEFVVFIRDITQRKNLEAETVAMLERERQVSEMKTRFISVASHEFRTPMAAALGSAEILRNHLDRLTPAKRDELFDRMGGSMRRMTEMLDEILTLSRIDAGRIRKESVTVDLVAFLQSVIDEVRLGDRDAHTFEYVVEGANKSFTTDPSVLRHVLSNLLTNAARYSPAGTTVRTTLRLLETEAAIEVLDHGIGIPPADLGRVFEAFERGSNVGQIKGTGLGLNIVKRMTELLGGEVAVQSTERVGSRFTVRLPRQSPTSS